MKTRVTIQKKREGAALIIALWTLMILSLIVGSFAFEMQLESRLVSHKRKYFLAQVLAESGTEYARAIINQSAKAKELEIEDMQDEDEEGFMQAALYVKRGLKTTSTIEQGPGSFSVTIESAEAGRNINTLSRDEWRDILEMANVPSTDWDSLLDCLEDWIDPDDLHKLNGAESDDPFYEEQGYPVKNAPLDSVGELLLIKGWTPEILYGKDSDEEGDALFGIADLLTVWGDGKVNLNTATTNVLLSYAEYEDWELASVMEVRAGEDGEEGTLDDGIKSLEEVGADPGKFKLQSDFVKVTSEGDVSGVKYQMTTIFLLRGDQAVIVYRKEGPVRKNAIKR